MNEMPTEALEQALLYKIPAIANGCTIRTMSGDVIIRGELAQVICAMVDYEARALLRQRLAEELTA
jgi:hypothetical protein